MPSYTALHVNLVPHWKGLKYLEIPRDTQTHQTVPTVIQYCKWKMIAPKHRGMTPNNANIQKISTIHLQVGQTIYTPQYDAFFGRKPPTFCVPHLGSYLKRTKFILGSCSNFEPKRPWKYRKYGWWQTNTNKYMEMWVTKKSGGLWWALEICQLLYWWTCPLPARVPKDETTGSPYYYTKVWLFGDS